jgi:hypothetical protein
VSRRTKTPRYGGKTATIKKLESSYVLPVGPPDRATAKVLGFDPGFYAVEHNGAIWIHKLTRDYVLDTWPISFHKSFRHFPGPQS